MKELLAAAAPYVPAGEPWVRIGGHLGRSEVWRCADAVLKGFLRAAPAKWRRELRAYAFLQGSGLPVPRLLASGELPVPWLLVSRLPGQTGAPVPSRSVGALLAELHALPVDERLTGEALPLAAERYHARLQRRIRECDEAATAQRPELERARAWARADVSGPLACAHGDFSPRNLLVQDGVITGLVDFEGCEYGDPAVDHAKMWVACPDLAWQAAYPLPLPSRERVLQQLGLIVLDAATWAPEHDPAYFERLLALVERA